MLHAVHTQISLEFWYPSCLHTTVASLVSHPLLVTVPQIPLTHTSTLPSLLLAPPIRRILPLPEHWGDSANLHLIVQHNSTTYWYTWHYYCSHIGQNVLCSTNIIVFTNLAQHHHSRALQLCTLCGRSLSHCVYSSADVTHCHNNESWWGQPPCSGFHIVRNHAEEQHLQKQWHCNKFIH